MMRSWRFIENLKADTDIVIEFGDPRSQAYSLGYLHGRLDSQKAVPDRYRGNEDWWHGYLDGKGDRNAQ